MTRTLLLSPSPSLAHPRGWTQIRSSSPIQQYTKSGTYDEVHCVGGGTLLLWLLAAARCAPRSRLVYVHGPMVYPTPESCSAWLARASALQEAPTGILSDTYEWSQQAIMMTLGGALPKEEAWLKPLLTSVATGRAHELGERALSMQRRWERNGRLVHRPLPRQGDDVLDALLRGRRFDIDPHSGGEALPVLLRCGQSECAAF